MNANQTENKDSTEAQNNTETKAPTEVAKGKAYKLRKDYIEDGVFKLTFPKEWFGEDVEKLENMVGAQEIAIFLGTKAGYSCEPRRKAGAVTQLKAELTESAKLLADEKKEKETALAEIKALKLLIPKAKK